MFDPANFHVGSVVLVIYAALAGSVVVQIVQSGKRAFDDVFTDRDRALVGAATFYLGLPAVLLLHEAIQVLVLYGFGARDADVLAWLERGALPSAERALSTAQIVVLTLSSIVVAVTIGGLSIAKALFRPSNAAWNFACLELGRVVIGVTLVIHPVVSLVLGHGSVQILRTALNEQTNHLGDAFSLSLIGLAVSLVRFSRRGRFQRWYVELATPLFHAIKSAKQRVHERPDDALAQRDLGGAYLAAARFDLADAPLTRSVSIDDSDPRAQFLLGMLRLKQERIGDAETALCAAGQRLDTADLTISERRGLELEIVIALASVRLQLSDTAGAIETAEAALQLSRRDPRALVVYSDALVAAGRSREAEAQLSLALEGARGPVEGEIRRRLAALTRGR